VPARHSQVVIFFVNGIGDYLVSFPMLRALAASTYPAPRLVWGENSPLAIFRDFDHLYKTEIHCTRGRKGLDFDVDVVREAIGGCDIFISAVPWVSPALESLIAGLRPQSTVGFFSVYDKFVPYDESLNVIDTVFAMATLCDSKATVSAYSAVPRFASRYKRLGRELLFGLPANTPLLVVHADTLPEKTWPCRHWSELLRLFFEAHSNFVVLLLGVIPMALDTRSHSSRIIPCYGVPLAASFSLLKMANLFVGVDSCLLHMADLFRVPCVGLFGPTEARHYGPRFASHIALQSRGVMGDILPNQVYSALRRLLDTRHCCEVWDVESSIERSIGEA
jgi:ADP-heptose:LPS heptosyltransferase